MIENSNPVGIVGIGSYAPEKILTNAELEKMVDTTDEWITSRTGIKERRIIAEGLASSSMGVSAAERALADAGVSPQEVEMIICCTATPDMLFPATACIIQKHLQATNAAAFDLEAGCSGFLYGVFTGSQMIKSGAYKTVLVVGADTLSRFTNWQDRSTCVLFGDGAGAVVLQKIKQGKGIRSFCLGADGSGDELLTLPAGGSLKPASLETVSRGEHFLQMDGNKVFEFAVKVMEKATLAALELAGVSPQEVDYFIPHQANIRIIKGAARRLNLPMDKVYVNVDKYGNTSCASIPLAIDEAVKLGKIKAGDILLLVAFGAGLTWASAVIEWGRGK